MILDQLPLAGAYNVRWSASRDQRGAFGRLFCAESFAKAGLVSQWAQTNLSRSSARGTLRGMHYQTAPFAETKLLVCLTGRIFDVLVDMRPRSASFGRWISLTLDGALGDGVYIPAGIAHGFQTLSEDVMLHYSHSHPYRPAHQAGLHYGDPDLAIDWPLTPVAVSERDRALPCFSRVTDDLQKERAPQ
ncbi:dTDP-4-dehydrorhamnose 3,5-epimerase family protein [Phaeobacter porticola]|uniref:dTDP-4-dehydrorhamnose 3,5-epimerase n=1 Tax=Phaeobacter porticola TaxID=1844006 RepID=A0A1L3I1Z3_9RHOB|nr:dTDP-4-dehydrorhamnose 3,5-epimerase family protein [Phaeobacter porticola]APG46136.1 dTDP-4-dehydrorhamnose 3,5-epimerase RfbC [Phaeobacter porticola]